MDNLRTPLTLPRKNPVKIQAVDFLPGEYFILARSYQAVALDTKVCFYIFSLQYIADVIKKLASKQCAVV